WLFLRALRASVVKTSRRRFRKLPRAGQFCEPSALHNCLHFVQKLLMNEAVGCEHIPAHGYVELASVNVRQFASGFFDQENACGGVPRVEVELPVAIVAS